MTFPLNCGRLIILLPVYAEQIYLDDARRGWRAVVGESEWKACQPQQPHVGQLMRAVDAPGGLGCFGARRAAGRPGGLQMLRSAVAVKQMSRVSPANPE